MAPGKNPYKKRTRLIQDRRKVLTGLSGLSGSDKFMYRAENKKTRHLPVPGPINNN